MLAASVAGTAASQQLTVGLSAGASIPTSTYGPSSIEIPTGWITTLHIRYDAGRSPFGVEVLIGYSSRPPQHGIGVVENYNSTLTGVWRAVPLDRPVKPYLSAGAGVDYYQDVVQNGITLGLNGGAGIAFGNGPWQPFVEGRYHWTFTNGDDLRMVMVQGGVRYRL